MQGGQGHCALPWEKGHMRRKGKHSDRTLPSSHPGYEEDENVPHHGSQGEGLGRRMHKKSGSLHTVGLQNSSGSRGAIETEALCVLS